ncbi:helix-turn-helix domain-containing protein [Persicitalea jodogahamensis]|uniref:helix-turn-helix domain-containing protein n=1 Tax=Persicitalea jodogahamensis TaxID=402147 RepID=UPI0016720807|nr:helix-turn-helix domain-containing protein [Persicitalea jodogahamensis]
MKRLNELLDQNLEKSDYTIDAICEDLGVSRSQLFRMVKELTGLSPSLYIRQRRLLRGQELLKGTDWRINEITDKIGFDSPQAFTKYFTQEFGLSPSDYRRQQEAGPPKQATPVIPSANDIGESTGEPPGEERPRGIPSVPLGAVPGKRWKYLPILGLVALVLLALGVFGYSRFLASSSRASSEAFVNSVAILPFRNAGTDTTALLADGLAGQIHSSLSAVENLKVISRSSAELFRDTRKTIPQIAAELHVNYILVGRLKQMGQHMLVSVELVEAAQDRTLWSKTYQGTDEALMGFMTTVARQTILALDQKLTDAESRRMDRTPTGNSDALREYLIGKQLMLSRSADKLKASLLRFDRAIALDSGFADAYARKALAYFLLGTDNMINLRKGISQSEQNALKAIRLDPENGLAYAILANSYRELNQWEQAVTTYQIALGHSPNDAEINYWYSITLRSLGRFEEAIQYSTKALALDPLYPSIIVGHIGNYSYAGRYAEARQLIKEYALMLDEFYVYYYVKAYYYLNLGDYTNALKEMESCVSLNPDIPVLHSTLQYCRARVGQRAAAEAYLKTIPQIPSRYPDLAIVSAGLNDKENCLKYLRLGLNQGNMPYYLKVSPIFRFLHGDPRFQEILRQLGLLDPQPPA